MASITYLPWKEIVLHEVREMPIASLLEFVVSSMESTKQSGVPAIQWVNGIAFVRGDFPETQQIIDDKLKGRLHFAMVSFARTSYEPQKKVTWNGREYSVRLVKAEDNPDLVNLAKFLETFGPNARNPTVSATP